MSDWTLTRLTESDDERWQAFVREQQGENGHDLAILQTIEASFGLTVERYAACDGERWGAILPLIRQESLLGKFWTSIPFFNYAGVLGSDTGAGRFLAEAIRDLAAAGSADRLEIRQRGPLESDLETVQLKSGYDLELPRDPEEIWMALKTKQRTRIRRCRKAGYSVRVVAADEWPVFWRLLSRRWHELGSPILPQQFFARLAERLGERVEIVLVEKDGQAAAAGYLLEHQGRIEIPWAASGREHDRFGVNMLLYSRVLERAVERGAKVFDFGRSTPGGGHATFKLQWGAVERPLSWAVWSRGSRGRQQEPGRGGRSLVASAWRRLPQSIADRLGPRLSPRIPY